MSFEPSAPSHVNVTVDGRDVRVTNGASVIVALVVSDTLCTRRSLSGEPRFALCGMGLCQECRVTIDGTPHRLACQTVCAQGMEIETGSAA
jgi:predicted molibdopterin-dependent oxidoreductase YjgC